MKPAGPPVTRERSFGSFRVWETRAGCITRFRIEVPAALKRVVASKHFQGNANYRNGKKIAIPQMQYRSVSRA